MKELKELAKIIRTILEDRTDIKYIPDLDFPIAKEVLKHYQPKLPEDSVVLTKEEYEQLKQTIISQLEESTKLCTHLTQKIIDTRKETAREILKEIRKYLDTVPQVPPDYYSDDWGYLTKDVDNGLNELAKQYGVEVDND